MNNLIQRIIEAEAADTAFEAAIHAAGYTNRRQWPRSDKRPLPAYLAKLESDFLMQQAFIAS